VSINVVITNCDRFVLFSQCSCDFQLLSKKIAVFVRECFCLFVPFESTYLPIRRCCFRLRSNFLKTRYIYAEYAGTNTYIPICELMLNAPITLHLEYCYYTQGRQFYLSKFVNLLLYIILTNWKKIRIIFISTNNCNFSIYLIVHDN